MHPRVLRHFKRRIGAKPTLVSPLEDATALCVSYSLNKLKKGTVKRLRRSHFQVGRKGKRVGNGRQSPLQKQRRKKKQRIPGVSERLAAANVLLKRVKMTPGLLSSEEETEVSCFDRIGNHFLAFLYISCMKCRNSMVWFPIVYIATK